jgi:hypothetical protein
MDTGVGVGVGGVPFISVNGEVGIGGEGISVSKLNSIESCKSRSNKEFEDN